jgi:biopolymer transport protein TolR
MARTFRRHRTAHPISELNVTNLVDLAFVLLLIFMIVTPVMQNEQTNPVNLPIETETAQPTPNPRTKYLSVTIDLRGNYSVDGRGIAANQLRGVLEPLALDRENTVIRIRADAGVNYQSVITLMDELKGMKLSRISFDTQARQ